VQDECVCKCISAVGACAAEGGVVDPLHNDGWFVANHFGEATVLVGPGVMRISWQPTRRSGKCCCWERARLLRGSNIENAVAKGTECDRGVTDVALVREHDLENGDVSDDRR
jgi:hypothetical protein